MNKRKYETKPEIKSKLNINVSKMEGILEKISSIQSKIIIFETYPGVDLEQVKKLSLSLNPKRVIWSEDFALQGKEFRDAIIDDLTEDRVFGKFTNKNYNDFFDKEKIKEVMSENVDGLTIVYGTGAYLFSENSPIIYFDINRWEIQLKYRQKKRVFFGGTLEDETIKNFKRGYFVEWRMADRIKFNLLEKSIYYVDANLDEFKMIKTSDVFNLLKEASEKPFRLVPYFDAGVWGGKWMEQKFDLGTNEHSKWAWGFDGVPEENSIRWRVGNDFIEMPAINLVHFRPNELLGQKVFDRFGAEFPIRFDFLDTIKGQNLSLQVHPTNEYIKEKFGAQYTQEESYYILDADEEDEPTVYLGLKTGVKKSEFIKALSEAQQTNNIDVEKYVNRYKAKKHDHFLHPGGVVHSSAHGCMVLEISATPYIFTFKLWDWGRVDFNGLPRPINIEHGEKVIDEVFDTEKTTSELVNDFKVVVDTNNYSEVKTGLHERQFIETRVFTFKNELPIIIENHDSVNMLNLVDGHSIKVESLDLKFEATTFGFAETFIVPGVCKKYKVTPINFDEKNPTKLLQAYVR